MHENMVRQIEEAQLFAERRADEHDAALRELSQRLMELVTRFDVLETKYEQLLMQTGQADAGEELPPHSGRLPGGR